ncbi:MAG: metallophosphoesterase [Planctomycetota bacterium]|nr:MAG: metallophosphoesterase [Planctomycetota bacterium]
MLVFISDLHFTDGTAGESINPRIFKVFRERLRDMVYDASWRTDKKYNPIKHVDLVLLGDIFDPIRSKKWIDGTIKPWGDYNSREFQDKVQNITDEIINHNREALGYLKSFKDPEEMTLPEAINGSPRNVRREPKAEGRIPFTINIHYVSGNHDWFYHLEGSKYDEIRNTIIDAMGLTNVPEKPFFYQPYESDILDEIYRQHEVVARHGDRFDPYNFDEDRNASSLGDAIVTELINRFPLEVEKQMKG